MMMGVFGAMSSGIFSDFSLETEAKKTNNYDKYYKEYKNAHELITQKKESLELVLKQKKFETLKIKLEKMKREK